MLALERTVRRSAPTAVVSGDGRPTHLESSFASAVGALAGHRHISEETIPLCPTPRT